MLVGSKRLSAIASSVIAASALGIAAAPDAAAEGDIWSVIDGRIVVDGGGFGHGWGMSQWGAKGAAEQGLSHQEILDFYYPGTTVGSTKQHFDRNIRVKLDRTEIGTWLRIAPVNGGAVTVRDDATGQRAELGDAPYFRVWRGDDGAWVVQTTDAKTTATDVLRLSGAARFASSTGQLALISPDAKRTVYRGEIVAVPRGNNVEPVNYVGMDDYLASVVPAESPPSWAMSALRAQSVAARTYAIRRALNKKSDSHFDVCSTISCQVYKGVASEHPRTTQAVRDTSTNILLYEGKVALTMFSASNGGFSVKYSDYTESRPDPYDGAPGNSVHRWRKLVDPAVLAKRWPSLGDPIYVEVLERDGQGPWGGRVTKARIHGSAGDVTVKGTDVRWAAKLRSNLATSPTFGIVHKWQVTGGRSGYLGDMTSGETAVSQGRIQSFERGSIFWSAKGGSRVLFGGIGYVYFDSGGVDAFGPPLSDEFSVDGGQRQDFAKGSAIWSAEHGAHMLYGAIGAAYDARGGVQSVGLPTSDEYDSPTGRAQNFTKGRLVWNRETGRVAWQAN